jgi:hypothetical protein
LSSAPTVTSPATAEVPVKTPGYLPVLLLLFAASGCSALIYEVVWYQLLQLAIGSTSVSLGILLATFMGGLSIGSIWFPRIARLTVSARHPLRVYAGIEAGIGVCALFVQVSLPYLSRAYVLGAEHGLPGMLLRGILAAVCMLPPTILMGASLPSIVRRIDNTRGGVAWWGFLYGGNTAGAVVGCLLAGFYLLRVYDMATATYVAVAINATVAAGSFLVSRFIPAAPEPVRNPPAAGFGRSISPSRFPEPPRSAPRWSGRVCWAYCCWRLSTFSRSSWRSSSPALPWVARPARLCCAASVRRPRWGGVRSCLRSAWRGPHTPSSTGCLTGTTTCS